MSEKNKKPMALTTISAADLPKPDTSHFIPWNLEMIFSVEPSLALIALTAMLQKKRNYDAKYNAYLAAKNEADLLIGFDARDPRLRSTEAWDYFFDVILDELNM